MKKSPIHIAGAGPAGLCAAIVLAQAGQEVHVHERNDRAGKRFQGDLQGLENWTNDCDVLMQLKQFGLDTQFKATPFQHVTITDGKRAFEHSSNTPLFYLVKRGPFTDSLDTHLCQQAQKVGVDMHFRSSLPIEQADIAATGPLRKAVIAIDKGVVFPTSLPNTAIAFFHDDLAYLGYSYLLVAEGYGCLCTVVFHDFQRLNKCFERTVELAKRMKTINWDHATPVGGIGSFCLDQPKQIGKTLFVGEAAGIQDLLWGFGIRSALTSGYLAAQSLINQTDYSSALKTTLEPLQKASLINRFLWETVKWQSKPMLPYLINLPSPFKMQFHHLYRFSAFHRFLYPIAKKYIKKQYPHSMMDIPG